MLTTIALAALSLSPTSPTLQSALEPRSPLGKAPVSASALPEELQQRLIVKFADEASARFNGSAEILSKSTYDLSAVRTLAAEEGLSFKGLLRVDEQKLEALKQRAAQRTGTAQPDLAGIATVEVPTNSPLELERIGARLLALPSVEFAYVQALGIEPPEDLAPTTPNLVPNQNYRGPNPGMNVDYAWSQGATGQGVRFSDCEYGWDPDHEDLRDIDLHLEPGQTIDPGVFSNNFDDHGTAVVGVTSSRPNAYGTSGAIPDAEVYTYPEWTIQQGFRRVTCITNAIADSSAGDVVLLEMQAFGPTGGFGPAEIDPAVWAVVKVGTDAGVIVVAAAGNGNQDLDSSPYDEYRSRGDSGAIIVGAGSANTSHNKLSFSTFGSRVNVQGWGESVFTLGYGGFAAYGGDSKQTYTSGFNGTSSASPFVASACAALQGIARAAGPALDPEFLRDHLIATGTPQGSGGHIGPFVDMQTAIDELVEVLAPVAYCNSKLSSAFCINIIDTSNPAEHPTSGANDYSVLCSDVQGFKNGLLFAGLSGPSNMPFSGGTLCVSPPLKRGPITNSGGTSPNNCSGSYSQSVNDGVVIPFGLDAGPGNSAWYQFWYRDPNNGPDQLGTALSNAIRLNFK